MGLALLLLRLVAGAAFVLHGLPKARNPFAWMGADSGTPAIIQALAALAEFGGGIAWILGLLTPVASAGILCTMLVAIWKHLGRGDPFVGKGGFDLAAIYATVALSLLIVGPGRWSLDASIARRR